MIMGLGVKLGYTLSTPFSRKRCFYAQAKPPARGGRLTVQLRLIRSDWVVAERNATAEDALTPSW